MLQGGDRHEGDILRGIGGDYWAEKKEKRERSSRLVEVDGYQVLRENLYSMEEGGITAWKETRQALAGGKPGDCYCGMVLREGGGGCRQGR
jgi:hypothetical protein